MAYRLTIFLGSFLLFLVQPMVGRTLLPAFGGTAAVWVVCLCAFQTLLLAGYLHAHRVASGSGRRRSAHLLLLGVSAAWAFCAHWAWMRFGDAAAGAAGGGASAWRALLCVAGLCGIPYVALSANSSLVQALAAEDGGEGRRAYRLYGVGNAGSLAGLLAYPLLMEPFVAVGAQWRIFGAGVALYALLLAAMMRAAGRRPAAEAGGATAHRAVVQKISGDGKGAESAAARPEVAPYQRLAWVAWLALPALSCFLLDAVTTHVTLDVMPMPMVWCLLLGLFLASYIVGFTGWAERNAAWLGALALASLCLVCGLSGLGKGGNSIVALFGSSLAFLAVGCTFLHTWLYSFRPGTESLTRFYLLGAVGGAVGGIAASLAAPMVFSRVTEWPLSLALVGAAAVLFFARRRRLGGVLALAAAIVAAVLYWHGRPKEWRRIAYRGRGFFGTVTVLESQARAGTSEGCIREFCHGSTVHGIQALIPGKERMPTTYYTPDACGWAIVAHPKYRRGEPMRVNLVGLGVGVLFCYGRTNDFYRAYEISEEALRVATDTNLFTFVSDCPAIKEIALGDARKGLEEERARGVEPYDVIVVDAFTGDNIPYHLSTREAFALYFSMLKPDGVLCVNISNWHLDLEPFMRSIGDAFNVPLLGLRTANDYSRLAFASQVAFFCRKPEGLAPPPLGQGCGLIDFNLFPAMSRLPTDDKGSFIGLLHVN